MGYSKLITYGKKIELYEYEEYPRNNGGRRAKPNRDTISSVDGSSSLAFDGQTDEQQKQQKKVRRASNIYRALVGFKRLIEANYDKSVIPLFITLTYSANQGDIKQGRKDFNAFAKRTRDRFGKDLRYVCVAEYQKRGAVHFHSLWWGLSPLMADTERDTRLVASLWGKGFVDVKLGNNTLKFINYMAKYFSKELTTPRHRLIKAYIASQNIIRPIVSTPAMIAPYLYDELSTVKVLHEKEYMTQYLGKGRYKLFEIIPKPV